MLLGNLPQTENGRLSPGINGNLETLDFMKKMARERSRHPKIRQLALRIVSGAGVQSQNYYDEARAIGEYVQKKVRYVRDINGVETVHDPLTIIDQIVRKEAHGDCDDMSLLAATLLLSIGHQPFFKVVRYKGVMGPYNHIYVVTYEKNWGWKKPKRLVLDCILKRTPIGTEVKAVSGDEIKV
jgi:hypothetical protein